MKDIVDLKVVGNGQVIDMRTHNLKNLVGALILD